MDKTLEQEIEEMAGTLEKATQDPFEKAELVIKSLGKDGLKERLSSLSQEDKVVLKSVLEQMKLKKAISFDKEAQSAKAIQGKVVDTIIQEEIASDDADEKLMKPEAAKMDHQGTPTDGWQGQVIKGENEDPKEKKARLDFGVKKPTKTPMPSDQKEAKKEEMKAMKKSFEEMVKAMQDKGFEKAQCLEASKRAGKEELTKAIETFWNEDIEKAKKEDAAKKIMAMEAKEHGTKDPKKLVEAEKKENMKKGMNKEEDQLGDAPEMKEKALGTKGSAPNIEDVAEASKQAQKDVNNMSVKEPMKKAVWDDENRLLKANTLGRNFHFDVSQFVVETLKNEGQPQTELKKSEKEDLNDLIEKSMDRDWTQVNTERSLSEVKTSGKIVKSFEDNDIAAILGLSEEEAKKLLG